MHVSPDMVLLALAILAHGWQGRIPPYRGAMIVAGVLNVIAIVLTLFFCFRLLVR
jgi:hypothetical protein